MSSEPSWGVVATIRASSTDILNFAAHHLDLGAKRIFIYLDADAPDARSALKRHPKCRVILTDADYWKRRRRKQGRPQRHQFRQSVNATHCYERRPEVDWLLHADVDEYLWPETSVAHQLGALERDVLSARARPIEVLQTDPADPPPDGGLWCKGFDPRRKIRKAQTAQIFPDYGAHLDGGLLGHVAGKVFVRTGREGVTLRIHFVFQHGERDPNLAELPGCLLIHQHARNWENWKERFDYRLSHGSYRSDLRGASAYDTAAMTLHDLLSSLERAGGEAGLREFYNEVCIATPDLRARLHQLGHLHLVRLDLDSKRRRHFGPDV